LKTGALAWNSPLGDENEHRYGFEYCAYPALIQAHPRQGGIQLILNECTTTRA
jgi:hypothetical protein